MRVRGFKDHRKLTMVGVRFEHGHCSLGGQEVLFRRSREGLGSLLLEATRCLGAGFTVPVLCRWGKIGVQTSPRGNTESGRCQTERVRALTKEQRSSIPESSREDRPFGFLETRGVLECLRRPRTVEECPWERLVGS